jgi:hypothetical protein
MAMKHMVKQTKMSKRINSEDQPSMPMRDDYGFVMNSLTAREVAKPQYCGYLPQNLVIGVIGYFGHTFSQISGTTHLIPVPVGGRSGALLRILSHAYLASLYSIVIGKSSKSIRSLTVYTPVRNSCVKLVMQSPSGLILTSLGCPAILDDSQV